MEGHRETTDSLLRGDFTITLSVLYHLSLRCLGYCRHREQHSKRDDKTRRSHSSTFSLC